mgnify:CR=1 FL=1
MESTYTMIIFFFVDICNDVYSSFFSDVIDQSDDQNIGETIEKIIEIFKQKTKNFDERIWDRLEIILKDRI